MALSYEGATEQYVDTLKSINLSFSIVFMCEAFLKLIAYGFRGYFYSSWNQFDFFVVSASIIDIILDYSG